MQTVEIKSGGYILPGIIRAIPGKAIVTRGDRTLVQFSHQLSLHVIDMKGGSGRGSTLKSDGGAGVERIWVVAQVAYRDYGHGILIAHIAIRGGSCEANCTPGLQDGSRRRIEVCITIGEARELVMVLYTYRAIVPCGIGIVHSVVLDHHVAIIVIFGIEDDLEFFQRGIVTGLDGILAVGFVPLQDIAVVCGIIPVEDAHIGKDIISFFSSTDYLAFEIVPIPCNQSIRAQSGGDIVVVEIALDRKSVGRERV